jgi:hypothetical protein
MSWNRQEDDDRLLRQHFGQSVSRIINSTFDDKQKLENEAERLRRVLEEIRSLAAAKRFWLFPFSRTLSAIIAKCDQAISNESNK